MPKEQTEHLVHLIKSLSKSEKRQFKLYAQRNKIGNLKFLHLFEAIEKQEDYNEDVILKKNSDIKKSQISNLKANLYKQILKSLRLGDVSQNSVSAIREQFDFARVLYTKGLYMQSLKILDKAKIAAEEHMQPILKLDIIEFEKYIESKYITRSLENRAEFLSNESQNTISQISKINGLSSLSLKLYGLYIKVGYIRNEKDAEMVRRFFKSELPNYRIEDMGFLEKLYLYQSYAWYHYILQDFVNYYKYSRYWVELFTTPHLIQAHLDDYLKGMHNLMSAQFNTMQYQNLSASIEKMESLESNIHIQDDNIKTSLFLFIYLSKINRHFIDGSFDEGIPLIKEIEDNLLSNKFKIDKHRILVFYYKIACLYFGSGNNRAAIEYLNKIINNNDQTLREDIHCYARILNLIAHYELGNMELVEYQIKSVYRYLVRVDELHMVLKEILKFLRKLSALESRELIPAFKNLRNKLDSLKQDPYEQRPYLYLDIISWLESKISGKDVQSVIKQKFKLLKR